MHVEDGKNWGVYVQSGSFTLYAGTSYASRSSAMDELHAVAPSFSLSGMTDIPYSARGVPSSAGIVTITRTGTTPQSIQINAAGGIFLQ